MSSNDEIGELARAFNTIQETTVRVAEEQAGLLRKGIGDLYVNLARRNQSLVDRQLSMLDVLEAGAEDPDQLASLFELDHLATRMRRNAESLLVLSGAGQSRQWSESIPILDVVRAASGEIADFARVSFVGFEGDVAIAGNAVADVTHILAELLENATSFSPPGSPVVVAGMLAERRFVVSITDEGIGMDDDRLNGANALVAGAASARPVAVADARPARRRAPRAPLRHPRAAPTRRNRRCHRDPGLAGDGARSDRRARAGPARAAAAAHRPRRHRWSWRCRPRPSCRPSPSR